MKTSASGCFSLHLDVLMYCFATKVADFLSGKAAASELGEGLTLHCHTKVSGYDLQSCDRKLGSALQKQNKHSKL